MTSPSEELQTMIGDALKADPDLTALIAGRVYDGAPSDVVFPYVTFGPSDFLPDDDIACIRGRIETLQVDVWSRDDGKKWPCKVITDRVCKVLHRNDALALATHALIGIEARARILDDPDGKTVHGVVTVTAEIEEAAP